MKLLVGATKSPIETRIEAIVVPYVEGGEFMVIYPLKRLGASAGRVGTFEKVLGDIAVADLTCSSASGYADSTGGYAVAPAVIENHEMGTTPPPRWVGERRPFGGCADRNAFTEWRTNEVMAAARRIRPTGEGDSLGTAFLGSDLQDLAGMLMPPSRPERSRAVAGRKSANTL